MKEENEITFFVSIEGKDELGIKEKSTVFGIYKKTSFREARELMIVMKNKLDSREKKVSKKLKF